MVGALWLASFVAVEVTAGDAVFWAVRVGVLLGLGVLAWRSPLLALLTWFVASPAGTYWLPRFNRIDLGLIFFIFLLQELRQGKRWRLGSFEGLYAAFCLLLAAHVVWLAQDPHSAFRLWLEAFVLPLGVYLMGRELVDANGLERFVRPALLLWGFLVAGSAVVEQVGKLDLFPTGQGLRSTYLGSQWLRVNGPYGDDATLAAIATLLLFVFLPGALGLPPSSGGRRRMAEITVCLLLVLAVVFTFFRTFWIVLALGVLVMLFAAGQRWRRVVLVGLLLAVLGAGVTFQRAEFADFYRERLADPANFYARLATYRMAWQMAREQPWCGVGFGNFTQAALTRPAEPYRSYAPVDYPHSGYFQLLAETGLPGLLLFLAALGCLLWPVVPLLHHSPARSLALGMALAFTSYLLANLVLALFALPPVTQLVFFFGGMAASRRSDPAESRQRIDLPQTSP